MTIYYTNEKVPFAKPLSSLVDEVVRQTAGRITDISKGLSLNEHVSDCAKEMADYLTTLEKMFGLEAMKSPKSQYDEQIQTPIDIFKHDSPPKKMEPSEVAYNASSEALRLRLTNAF